MDEPEYLIIQYDLKDWMNPSYKGNDWKAKCKTVPRQTVNGLIRL